MLSVTVTEPRFTPREKALLLASWREDHIPRGSHGLPLSVATDPANEGKFVPEPVRDFAAQALDRAQEAYRKEYEDTAEPGSLIWTVELTE